MSQNNNTEKKIRRYILYAFISFLAIFLFAKCFSNSTESVSLLETDYSTFKEMIQTGSFSKVYFSADYLIGQIKSPDEDPALGFQYTTPRLDDASLIPLLEEKGIPFSIEETVSSSTGTWYLVLVALLPIIFFFIELRTFTFFYYFKCKILNSNRSHSWI
jgi:ATP-dependent Zn protease